MTGIVEATYRSGDRETRLRLLLLICEGLTIAGRVAESENDFRGLVGVNELQHTLIQQIRHVLRDEPGIAVDDLLPVLEEVAAAWDANELLRIGLGYAARGMTAAVSA